jgi:hypothetical protein
MALDTEESALTPQNDPSGLGILASPELTRHPQPTYKMLRDSTPVLRVDGIGVLVSTWKFADELRTALGEWHARIPDYHIKPGVELDFTPGVRAVQTFPMILGRSD